MDLQIPSESLTCLTYPGIVLNSHKALHTLGGLQALKEVKNWFLITKIKVLFEKFQNNFLLYLLK